VATVTVVAEQTTAHDKRMKLRYAGTCRICGVALPAGTEAVYERETKTIRCLIHDPDATAHSALGPARESTSASIPAPTPEATDQLVAVDEGTPGGSARREFEKRQRTRQDRVRAKHPKLGGLILAVSDDPQSTRAWQVGAVGEERLGGRLNELAGDALRVLHDRRIPGSRTNIDHLGVTPTGIWVIDAKKYKGRPQLKVDGGIIRARTEKLLVGSRDCTKLVDGMLKQIQVVQAVIGIGIDVPVHGVLCFVEADWPIFGGAFRTRGVEVMWPKKLYPKLHEPGPITNANIDELQRRLAAAFPPA
jgi:hypothetical protein